MSGTLIGMFDLLDRRTGKFVEAQVVSPAGSSNVADIDASWRPLMQARIEHLRAQNRLAKTNFRTLIGDGPRRSKCLPIASTGNRSQS